MRGEAVSKLKYWIWLSGCTSVSPNTKKLLLDFYGDAEAVFNAPPGDYAKHEGITRAEAETLEKRDMSRVDDILERCGADNIRIITLADSAYPERLKSIYAPPAVLYIKGTLPDIDDCPAVAVIGTRKASPYGLKMGKTLSYEICRCGGAVVSGLTAGIDAAAARGALSADGICIGVLGTSHDLATGSLAKDIAVRGALVSEYPPGTKPVKAFFRARNRIASGLSLGVVVVEAPEVSGTRLFVSEAVSQGREVFAVPGNADSQNSAGTIEMIKDGAKTVTQGWEVMIEFLPHFPEKITIERDIPLPDFVSDSDEDIRSKHSSSVKKAQKRSAPQSGKTPSSTPAKQVPADRFNALSDVEKSIVEAILTGSVHIDDIIEKTDLSAATVLSRLTILEIKGIIRREAGSLTVNK